MDRDSMASLGLLWLRVMAGLGIAYHGYQKIFGGNMEMFLGGVGEMGVPFPVLFGWMAALSEFVGGLLLVLGLATRVAAFFIFMTMAVAVFVRHAADPFAVKELALAFFTMSATLVLTGAGRISLDSLIAERNPEGPEL